MRKYKIIVFVVILFTITLTDKVSGLFFNDMPLANKIIYIDPGHGGIDCGAVYKDLKESKLNLDFSKMIGNTIQKLGGTIYYTRNGDYDLSSTKTRRKLSDLTNRIKIINESKADMYISIHMNSEESNSWHGAQIFYTNNNIKNIKIAKLLQESLNIKGITKRNISVIRNAYMYNKIDIPGVLVEVGFISNYSDRIKLNDEDYAQKFSETLVEGIVKYFR